MSYQNILKGVPNEKCHESLGYLLSVTLGWFFWHHNYDPL